MLVIDPLEYVSYNIIYIMQRVMEYYKNWFNSCTLHFDKPLFFIIFTTCCNLISLYERFNIEA